MGIRQTRRWPTSWEIGNAGPLKPMMRLTSGHCSDAIVSYLFIYCRSGGIYRKGQPDGGLKDLA